LSNIGDGAADPRHHDGDKGLQTEAESKVLSPEEEMIVWATFEAMFADDGVGWHSVELERAGGELKTTRQIKKKQEWDGIVQRVRDWNSLSETDDCNKGPAARFFCAYDFKYGDMKRFCPDAKVVKHDTAMCKGCVICREPCDKTKTGCKECPDLEDYLRDRSDSHTSCKFIFCENAFRVKCGANCKGCRMCREPCGSTKCCCATESLDLKADHNQQLEHVYFFSDTERPATVSAKGVKAPLVPDWLVSLHVHTLVRWEDRGPLPRPHITSRITSVNARHAFVRKSLPAVGGPANATPPELCSWEEERRDAYFVVPVKARNNWREAICRRGSRAPSDVAWSLYQVPGKPLLCEDIPDIEHPMQDEAKTKKVYADLRYVLDKAEAAIQKQAIRLQGEGTSIDDIMKKGKVQRGRKHHPVPFSGVGGRKEEGECAFFSSKALCGMQSEDGQPHSSEQQGETGAGDDEAVLLAVRFLAAQGDLHGNVGDGGDRDGQGAPQRAFKGDKEANIVAWKRWKGFQMRASRRNAELLCMLDFAYKGLGEKDPAKWLVERAYCFYDPKYKPEHCLGIDVDIASVSHWLVLVHAHTLVPWAERDRQKTTSRLTSVNVKHVFWDEKQQKYQQDAGGFGLLPVDMGRKNWKDLYEEESKQKKILSLEWDLHSNIEPRIEKGNKEDKEARYGSVRKVLLEAEKLVDSQRIEVQSYQQKLQVLKDKAVRGREQEREFEVRFFRPSDMEARADSVCGAASSLPRPLAAGNASKGPTSREISWPASPVYPSAVPKALTCPLRMLFIGINVEGEDKLAVLPEFEGLYDALRLGLEHEWQMKVDHRYNLDPYEIMKWIEWFRPEVVHMACH